MGINPLQHFTAPLKGETAAAYWQRMVSVAPAEAREFLRERFGEYFKPADYRDLIQVLNANLSQYIARHPKTGRALIECPPTQSGAVCLERHIARGGFDIATRRVPMSAAETAAVRQPEPPEVHYSEPEYDEPRPQPVYSAPQPQPQPQPTDTTAAAAALAALAALMPKQGIDETAVRSIVADMMQQQAPAVDAAAVREIVADMIGEGHLYKGIEIREAGKEAVKIDGQFHSKFPDLLRCLKARQSVYLYGPAGTSKTTSARAAAKALGLPFVLEVVGLTSTKTDFLGFVDAGGRCTETNFKRAFLNGGVYFIDEADSANANVGIALNTAIENRICAFPDGVFEAHPDFVAVAAGNTNGKGGTAQFGGRVRMDSAFQDRFAFLHWPIDEAFERAITANQAWTAKVQKIRAAVAACGIDDLAVTPRVAIKGERLLAAGFSEAEVLDMLLFRGAVSEEVKTQIFSRI